MRRNSEKAHINRVYRRVIALAKEGKWFACSIVQSIHLWNRGLEFTDGQRLSIQEAMSHSPRYPSGDSQLEEAYANF